MRTARVDIILYIADRNDSRQITLLMNTCCEFFSWPKFLMTRAARRSYYNRAIFTLWNSTPKYKQTNKQTNKQKQKQ